MVIRGYVERIIYRNVENGYTVLLLDSNGKITSCVGILPPIGEETELEVMGEMGYNNKYGEQLNVTTAKIIMPTNAQSMVKYLASGLFSGVGEVTAELIVDKFGTKTFEIIRDDPAQLAAIKGVSISKAMRLHEQFVGLEDMQEAIVYLQGLEISLNLGMKIYKKYGKATHDTVVNNPYKLVEDIDGVGFYTADKIAVKMGIPSDSKFRITAGIHFTLSSAANNNGHSYLPKEELIEQSCKLLNIDMQEMFTVINDCISDLEIQGKLIITERDGELRVMSYKYYITEKSIAIKIINIKLGAKPLNRDIEADIADYERIHGIELHIGQKDAVANAIKSGVNVITGGPGTGKTTIIKCVLQMFESLGLKVLLCAPTGRASKRLNESTGVSATTIHRLLDLDFKNGKGFFTYNENTKLDCDVVIVDEISMCDEYVYNALISAIPDSGRLIMVGDKDQLPSVGVGNVLSDIINSDIVPISYLTHIYRQSEESLIIENAHRINKGIMPILRNNNSDFLFNEANSPLEVMNHTISLVTDRIPKFLNIDPHQIQVLCPLKRGVAGANNLNIELQKNLNPPSKHKREIHLGDNIYRQGDKVIHTVNNYSLEWEKGSEEGKGVFNGDIGFISDVGKDDLVVKFEDGREALYTRESIGELLLAYAISVHKSQGSEFKVVVIALTAGAYTILTRNLLYTAVTRAKSMSVLVGDSINLGKMVRNNYTTRRYTLLTEFVEEESRRREGKKVKN